MAQVMSRKVQPTYTPEEVKAAFKVFETANTGLPSGHVKTSVLERALTTYGTEKLTLEEAQDLLSQVRLLRAAHMKFAAKKACSHSMLGTSTCIILRCKRACFLTHGLDCKLGQVDPENTGSINYVEYVNMMCST